MGILYRKLVAGGAALVACAALAQPMAMGVTVADTAYPSLAEVQGSKLLLNGAGVRYKTVFKVYTAGLYLERKAGTQQEVVALPGTKRLSITMLRDIDSRELGKLF